MNLKININRLFIALLGIVVLSCADPNLAPIVTFDDAGHGAYPRLISDTGEQNVNFFDMANSQYTYSVEFVSEGKGSNVAAYVLSLAYEDVNGVDDVAAFEWKTFDAASFTTSAEGYKAVENTVISATDMISAVGLTEADISQADKFFVTGKLVLNDGREFTGPTSSATVTGAAFQGLYDMTFPVVCPSDLAGTHTVSTVAWCGETISGGTTTWVAVSNGVYKVEADYANGDYSFGAYDACYGDPPPTFGAAGFYPQGNLRINDLCNQLYWTGASQWTEIYTFNSVTVNGADLILDWSNSYGEGGVTTLTREGGANWPAELHN